LTGEDGFSWAHKSSPRAEINHIDSPSVNRHAVNEIFHHVEFPDAEAPKKSSPFLRHATDKLELSPMSLDISNLNYTTKEDATAWALDIVMKGSISNENDAGMKLCVAAGGYLSIPFY